MTRIFPDYRLSIVRESHDTPRFFLVGIDPSLPDHFIKGDKPQSETKIHLANVCSRFSRSCNFSFSLSLPFLFLFVSFFLLVSFFPSLLPRFSLVHDGISITRDDVRSDLYRDSSPRWNLAQNARFRRKFTLVGSRSFIKVFVARQYQK